MMRFILISFFVLTHCVLVGQTDLNGTWKGYILKDGLSPEKAQPVYLELEINKSIVNGFHRQEIFESTHFAIKKIRGQFKDDKISFSEISIEKTSKNSKNKWCTGNFELMYNDTTGYLSGKYVGVSCKGDNGTIVLYKSTNPFHHDELDAVSHQWMKQLTKDIKEGLNAPEIREREMRAFVFKPVYFDYDKDELKAEFYPFLLDMIRVIKSHSDLRIKITGHTDSDGSDEYNEDLSRRRAESLVNFFVRNGMQRDRIVIDFKGEKEPVDSNKTDEGKQRNRRVDFSFI
jgi:OmpA-OmpF porin, OOP family